MVCSHCLLVFCSGRNCLHSPFIIPLSPPRSRRSKVYGSEYRVHIPVSLANSSSQLSKFALFLCSPNLLLLDNSSLHETLSHAWFSSDQQIKHTKNRHRQSQKPPEAKLCTLHGDLKENGCNPSTSSQSPCAGRWLLRLSVSVRQQQKNL